MFELVTRKPTCLIQWNRWDRSEQIGTSIIQNKNWNLSLFLLSQSETNTIFWTPK